MVFKISAKPNKNHLKIDRKKLMVWHCNYFNLLPAGWFHNFPSFIYLHKQLYTRHLIQISLWNFSAFKCLLAEILFYFFVFTVGFQHSLFVHRSMVHGLVSISVVQLCISGAQFQNQLTERKKSKIELLTLLDCFSWKRSKSSQ